MKTSNSNQSHETKQFATLDEGMDKSLGDLLDTIQKLASMVQLMIDQLEAEGALYCEKDGQEVRPVMPWTKPPGSP